MGDVRLKEARLARLREHPAFSFRKLDIVDRKGMAEVFSGEHFDAVMHLAAQAGVRYSAIGIAQDGEWWGKVLTILYCYA